MKEDAKAVVLFMKKQVKLWEEQNKLNRCISKEIMSQKRKGEKNGELDSL